MKSLSSFETLKLENSEMITGGAASSKYDDGASRKYDNGASKKYDCGASKKFDSDCGLASGGDMDLYDTELQDY